MSKNKHKHVHHQKPKKERKPKVFTLAQMMLAVIITALVLTVGALVYKIFEMKNNDPIYSTAPRTVEGVSFTRPERKAVKKLMRNKIERSKRHDAKKAWEEQERLEIEKAAEERRK